MRTNLLLYKVILSLLVRKSKVYYFSFFVKKNEKMEKVCEGEDLGVANGRISPSRSPFLATDEIVFGLHSKCYVNHVKDL